MLDTQHHHRGREAEPAECFSCVHEGMTKGDAALVVVILALFAGAAVLAEDQFHLNGDVVFGFLASGASHPTHALLQRAAVKILPSLF